MAKAGIIHEQMARVLGFSRETLEKFYRHELDNGVVHANMEVAERLFNMTKKNPAAAMFWLKCRAGWRENDVPTFAGNQSYIFKFSDIDPKNKDEILLEH